MKLRFCFPLLFCNLPFLSCLSALVYSNLCQHKQPWKFLHSTYDNKQNCSAGYDPLQETSNTSFDMACPFCIEWLAFKTNIIIKLMYWFWHDINEDCTWFLLFYILLWSQILRSFNKYITQCLLWVWIQRMPHIIHRHVWLLNIEH